MAEDTPAAAKAPKRKGASRTKRDRPSLRVAVLAVVAFSKERRGVSMMKIKKCLKAEGVDVEKKNRHINNTVSRLVSTGTLIQTKGKGASGSYKLAKTDSKPAKKVAKKTPTKAKKTGTTKTTAKKTTAKKTTAKKQANRAGAKTAAKKPKTAAKKAAATPKKKTATKAAVKKTSPKKKTVAKGKPTKTSAAKKSTAKKTVAKKSKK